MANTGRKIYQFLKQIDSITGLETGLKKANVQGDPDYVPPVVDYATCPIIAWEAIDPVCTVTPTCASGYTLVDGACVKIESMEAKPPTGNGGSPGTVAKVNNIQWNNGGARIYKEGFPLSGNGVVDVALLLPHLWVNGDTVWDPSTRNLVDGRMNAAGIWSESFTPDGEYIGFSRKITVPSAKKVYIGVSADNCAKVALNGVTLLEIQNISGGGNFNFWNIYPIDLRAGDNFIEMFGMNLGSAAGFAVEIYDMTKEELQAATQESDLNILFSTKDIVGQNFDLGETQGWSCEPGWFLDTTNYPICKRIISENPVMKNTGMKEFLNRRRIVNGFPDGFVEPNDNAGEGPYFAPVQDLINCPL